MTNIQEIAERAGVSSATVSRVINNRNYVSKETRKKVEAVIRKYDYVPNSNAVSLKKGTTKLIGVVAPVFSESLNVFTRNFTMAAQENGYNVTFFMTKIDRERELDALEMLRRKQLDALVLVIRLNDWELIEKYTKYGPIVTWQRVEREKIPSVFMNHYDGYMLALEHLYSKGYRKIVNIYGNTTGLNTQSRILAFQDFCHKYTLNSHEHDHFYEMGGLHDGEKIAHWWQEQEQKPDAFICANDYLAAGIVTEARRLAIKIPEQFAVCGFDDMDIAHMLDMTTIHYPVGSQAENAFTIIQNALEGKYTQLQELGFYLVERQTT